MTTVKVTCPFCGERLEAEDDGTGDSAQCPSCSKEIRIRKGTRYTCPKCGSEQCRKVSVVYESGTTTGTMVGVGTDFDGDFGVAGGRTTNRSLLASRLAPPAEPDAAWVGLYVLFIVSVVIGSVWMITTIPDFRWQIIAGGGIVTLMLLAFCISAIRAYLGEKEKYPSRLDSWSRQWVCLKCGHVWHNS